MPKSTEKATHEDSSSAASDAAEKMLKMQTETLNNLAAQFVKTVNYSTEVSEIVSRKIVDLTTQQSAAASSAQEEFSKIASGASMPADINALAKMQQQYADAAMRHWTETAKRSADWSKDLVARIMDVSLPK
jgi:hypothetical protein